MRGQWRAVTQVARTADEYAVWLGQLLALEGLSFADLDAAIIATVVPAVLFDLRDLLPQISQMRAAGGGRSRRSIWASSPMSTGPKRWAPTGCATPSPRMTATRAR